MVNKNVKMGLNRKGGERLLSVYWFLIFLIVAIAVVSGVYIFFSKPIDVREAETGILNDKLISCFVDDGKLRNLDVTDSNLEDRCGLDFADRSVRSDGNLVYSELQYYVEVDIGLPGGEKVIKLGNENYKPFCGQEKSRMNIPYCYANRLVALNGGELVAVTVISAIKKIEQNAV